MKNLLKLYWKVFRFYWSIPPQYREDWLLGLLFEMKYDEIMYESWSRRQKLAQ